MPRIRISRQPDPTEVSRILHELPDWFGIEEAIVGCARDLERLPGFAASTPDGEVVEIALVRRHDPESAELHLIRGVPGPPWFGHREWAPRRRGGPTLVLVEPL
ncbi:MAG: hypothetical protein ABIQ15_05880 [Nocardioides sp.]